MRECANARNKLEAGCSRLTDTNYPRFDQPLLALLGPHADLLIGAQAIAVSACGAEEEIVGDVGSHQCGMVGFASGNKGFVIFGMHDEGRRCLRADWKIASNFARHFRKIGGIDEEGEVRSDALVIHVIQFRISNLVPIVA